MFNSFLLIQNTKKVKSLSVNEPYIAVTNIQTDINSTVTSFDILMNLQIYADSSTDFFIVAAFLQNSYLLTKNINVSYADYEYTDIHFALFDAGWMCAHEFFIGLYNSTSDTTYNSSSVRIWRDFWNVLHTDNTLFSRYLDNKHQITASRNGTQIGMYYYLTQDGGWTPFGYIINRDVNFLIQTYVHFSMNYSTDYLSSSENDYPKPFLPWSLYRGSDNLSTTLYQRFITIAPILIIVFVVFSQIKKLTKSDKYIGVSILPASIFVLIYLQAAILEYIITIILGTALSLKFFKKNEGAI
jgi:hypothetical protein